MAELIVLSYKYSRHFKVNISIVYILYHSYERDKVHMILFPRSYKEVKRLKDTHHF